MLDVITALITNLFRILIIKKFISIFFTKETENKGKEKFIYFLFYFITTAVYLAFHFPPANIVINLLMIYLTVQMIYEGEQIKKILISLLIYGINMACDVFSIYSFSNYIVGNDYNEIAAYITVLMINICEFIIEKFVIKKRGQDFTPPHWNILILIPVVSIAMLICLLMNNLNHQKILILVSAGILFINMLIFYLYNALLDTYVKLEENSLYERKIACYANQVDVLMQSEKKINSLRHDMKHHLNELLIMATGRQSKQDIAEYIQNMQMFMENKKEFSCSGNMEIDSILNYMLYKAQESLKEIEYKISIPKEIGILSFDLNIIFGNLLENAILAADSSNRKWLSVFVHFDKGMLFINIQNSYNGTLNKRNEIYLTTKTDKTNHGIGLQNVKRVVKKYDGSIEISDKDNIFDIKIVLYIVRQETALFT